AVEAAHGVALRLRVLLHRVRHVRVRELEKRGPACAQEDDGIARDAPAHALRPEQAVSGHPDLGAHPFERVVELSPRDDHPESIPYFPFAGLVPLALGSSFSFSSPGTFFMSKVGGVLGSQSGGLPKPSALNLYWSEPLPSGFLVMASMVT